MKPLRLTWQLATPIATSAYPIHLDDLVAYAQTQLKLRMAEHNPHDEGQVRDLALDLPLGKETRGDASVWQASALMPPDDALISHGMRFWTSKTDSYDYAQRFAKGQLALRGKPETLKPYGLQINTQGGLLKNGYKFYGIKRIPSLQAWCIGEPDALAELLDPAMGSPLMWIGARGRSGHGRITSFEMVEDPAAEQMWEHRSLPWPHAGGVQMRLATHPPYWDAENQRTAWARPSIFW